MTVRTIGLAGTGVIGAGWAVRVLAGGHDVIAWDPADDAEDRLRIAIERAWPSATRLGLFPGAAPDRLRWAGSPEEAAAGADLVQESAPEDFSIKSSLLRRLDAAAEPDTVIASSSSGLLPTRLAEGLRHPERLIIGHPFNPVYLLPLVEVVPGEATSERAVAAAVAHYDDLVMHPLVVRNEIEGYLSDRLQEALWRENLHLVNEGVATTAELDDSITYGPGLRWAAMGTNLTFHLAGGDGGMRHMLGQFGPALKLPWTRLQAPELTGELIEAMAEGCEDQAGGRSIAELERRRDDCLLAVMRALRPSGIGAGRLMAEREARILAAGAAAAAEPWAPGAEIAAPTGAVLGGRGARLGGLQRPHDRVGLPDRLRVGVRRAVPLLGHRRGLPGWRPLLLHGRDPPQPPAGGLSRRAAAGDHPGAGQRRQAAAHLPHDVPGRRGRRGRRGVERVAAASCCAPASRCSSMWTSRPGAARR